MLVRQTADALVGDVSIASLQHAFARVGVSELLVDRVEMMIQRAQRIEPDLVDLEALNGRALELRAWLGIQLAQRTGEIARSFEVFAAAAASVVHAERWSELTDRAVEALQVITELPVTALYVSADESARMVLTARTGQIENSLATPQDVRIDHGLLADVLAGERAAWVGGEAQEVMGDVFPLASAVMALPLRDQAGRPVGMLVGLSDIPVSDGVSLLSVASRLASVVEGALVVADRFRRDASAVSALPAIATLDPGLDLDSSLDQLARILGESTSSDAVLVRVADPDGNAIRVRGIWSKSDEISGEIVGSAAEVVGLGSVELCEANAEWLESELHGVDLSYSTRRAIELLDARSVAFVAVPAGAGRAGLGRPSGLVIIRRTARPLRPVDSACATIVAAHVGRLLDVGDAETRTNRAVGAARTAIRLLGEALVAGVRADRTLRFVPRLYLEMFNAAGCRVLRLDNNSDSDAAPVVLATHGAHLSEKSYGGVLRAAGSPLQLFVEAIDGRQHAAVGFEEYTGSTIVIELILPENRALGDEERDLATDVANRIEEAVLSADRAAAQRIQLDRVRALQEVVSSAYTELTESHVTETVVEQVPAWLGARAAAAFIFDTGGELRCAVSTEFPDQLRDAIIAERHWVPGAAGDDRDDVQRIENVSADPRIATFQQAFAENDLDGGAMLAIPFIGREQTLGALILLVPDGLPAQILDRQDMLPAFGRHVGTALVHASSLRRERERRERLERQLEQEREASRQVRALHEVASTFADSLSFDETLRAVVEAMAHRLDVDAVWIRTPDERGNKMILRAFYASQPELTTALQRMVSPPDQRDDPVNAHVMQSRQPILVQGGESGQPGTAGSEILGRLEPFLQRGSSLAVLPVARPTDTETLGTLTLLSIDPDHALTYDKVDIASTVTAQAALALDNARLYEQQKHFAEVIQESLLPGRLPDVDGIDLGVLYRAATAGGADAPAIGGDFYDFLELEDGRLALAVGDVTGKGVGAAADTAMTKYIFRALAREHPSPAAFLAYANQVICEEITPGKFVTLFYAVIDPDRGEIICGNAGHPEPKLLHVDENGEAVIESISLEGLALGILPDQDFQERRYSFGPGRSIVAYTDGVVEARRDSRLYGQYRLERRLSEEAGASATRLAFAVYEDCNAYAEDRLGDDVAIVVAQHVFPEDQSQGL